LNEKLSAFSGKIETQNVRIVDLMNTAKETTKQLKLTTEYAKAKLTQKVRGGKYLIFYKSNLILLL